MTLKCSRGEPYISVWLMTTILSNDRQQLKKWLLKFASTLSANISDKRLNQWITSVSQTLSEAVSSTRWGWKLQNNPAWIPHFQTGYSTEWSPVHVWRHRSGRINLRLDGVSECLGNSLAAVLSVFLLLSKNHSMFVFVAPHALHDTVTYISQSPAHSHTHRSLDQGILMGTRQDSRNVMWNISLDDAL